MTEQQTNNRVAFAQMGDPEKIDELRKSFRALDQREIHIQKMLERMQVIMDNLERNKVDRAEFERLCGEIEGKEEGAEKAHEWWKWGVGIGFALLGATATVLSIAKIVGVI